ncbi:MAG TPA: tetratricopeptide repeat protein [Deltaproteobacteria bacterium]|nr:tetratricopeptide repeat protein [Deltaproteobacteria bacterium]
MMRRALPSGMLVTSLLLAGCPKDRRPETPIVDEAPEPGEPDDSTRPVYERINEAADRIESGTPADLERAITLLQGVIEEDDTGTARFNLGLAYQARGDLELAAGQYQAVIAAQPDMGDAWLYLGKVQEQQGQLEAAAGSYSSGIRNEPEHMGLRIAQVALLRRQGRLDEAVEAAKAALKVNANSLPIYNNFALVYLDKGDTTLARFILQKALQSIEGAVGNAYLHTNLGWSYYLDGNKPAALRSLEKAVELDPQLVPALVYLSRVYMEDHNYGDVVPLLETAEAIDATNPDVQLNLGIAYRGVGELQKARAAYERALALDPSDPDPYFNLGILLSDFEKDYDGAIASFNQYLAAGGSERERALEYISDVEKEKERAERRKKAEADRQRREEERKRKERVLREAEAARGASDPGASDPGASDPGASDPGASDPESRGGETTEGSSSGGGVPGEETPEEGASEEGTPPEEEP